MKRDLPTAYHILRSRKAFVVSQRFHLVLRVTTTTSDVDHSLALVPNVYCLNLTLLSFFKFSSPTAQPDISGYLYSDTFNISHLSTKGGCYKSIYLD